jgi:hypothetical protein
MSSSLHFFYWTSRPITVCIELLKWLDPARLISIQLTWMRWHGWKIISRHGPEHSSLCDCWRYSLPIFVLTLFLDPMIVRSSMQSRQTLSINIPAVLIIIKGNSKTEQRRSLINGYLAIFLSSIQQNPNGNETCDVNTTHKWSIASIYKRSSTDGDIMPTVLHRHSPRSKSSRK